MKPENTIPFCNHPDAATLEKLDNIDVASILGSVGVRFERDDEATEYAGGWYESSENCWRRQYGVRWETGRRSVILVSVRDWGMVTVTLEAFGMRGGVPFAYAAEVGRSFAVGEKTAAAFAGKIRAAVAA